jgi:hypothetical protein
MHAWLGGTAAGEGGRVDASIPGAQELKAYPVIRKAEATAALGPEVGRSLAF